MINFLFVVLFFCQGVNALVQSRTSSGSAIKWPASNPNLVFYYDTQKLMDLSVSQFLVIANESIVEFNTKTKINMQLAAGTDASNVNSISFSTEPFFGSGVLAVTNVSFNVSSGQIKEADIIINENFSFSNSKTASSPFYYLGDVITHELGHAVGLAHTEVHDSTMIYTAFQGQFSLSTDDVAGLNSIYPDSTKGTISGKIVGGVISTGLFGVHVQAISHSSGLVAGSTLSSADGTFSIGGLNLNDTYYLYSLPVKNVSAMPAYYSSINTKICSGANFRGSFYSPCDALEREYPLGVLLNTTNVSVGNITVRCNYNLTADYLDQKTAINRDERLLWDYDSEEGGSLAGSFFGFERLGPGDTTYSDKFIVDLTGVTSPVGKYLDLRFISQSLFSYLTISAYITRAEGINPAVYNYVYNKLTPDLNSDSLEKLSRQFLVPLSSITSENIFTIRLVGISESQMNNVDKLFPAYTTLGDTLSPYFVVASLSDGLNTLAVPNYLPLVDNTSCREPVTVTMNTPFVTNKDSGGSGVVGKVQNLDSGGPISCATVALVQDDDDFSGPSSFLGGFLLALLSLKLIFKLKKNIVLSR